MTVIVHIQSTNMSALLFVLLASVVVVSGYTIFTNYDKPEHERHSSTSNT